MVGHVKDLDKIIFKGDAVKDASMKVLVSAEEGWDSHVMRVVRLDEHGYSPRHSHPWPHINYMLEGNGEVLIDGTWHPVEAGSYAFVPENKEHQFRNTGSEIFRFICIVPSEGNIY